ncbi:MAG TPA: condensation domain-containing protein, partial [Herpetosiphonaceae bacterium]
PTEAAVTATTCSVFDQTRDQSFDHGVPIGYPLGQRTAYILDRYNNPVPIGVVGELYLGGVSLARGYLGQAALTAERFIPDPFSRPEGTRPGSRLYKTGDLAHYLPDGRILFIGRADRQIKIRGFRVELTEIEAAISRHPAVGETIVLARQVADAADKHLVAYLVAVPGQQVTAAELRTFLLRSLPEYMVPGDMVVLDKFPLTPNGKVDRGALPDLETLKAAQRHTYVAPRTAVEEALAEIWADVFNVERVGVYDNFFDLGGHSLIATQLIARLRNVLRVEVSLRSLMNAPTIAGLARAVEQSLRAARGVAAPPLVPVSRTSDTWPPSFAQQRLWFLQQFEPDSPAYNMPGRIRIRGALNQAALVDSLAAIVQRHDVLRTTFALVDGQPVQIVAPSIEWHIAQEDLRHLSPEEQEAMVADLTAQDAARLFDLQNGPLLRATLLRLDQAEYVLLLNMHHLVADERSINIFVQELSELYEASTAGKPAILPDLPLQYVDYAVWQRDWFQGAALDAQMAYWKTQLADAPALLDLPTDRPRPATQTFRGGSQPLSLSRELTDALKTLSRRHETTLFMTTLAAFQVLLSRYSGQDDIVVGSPIISRTQTEAESLIGCFINTLVLRTNLSGDPSFRDVLSRVREATLGAYAHQDLPFEKLVEELQPERDLSRHPLFQIMFTLQHQAVTELTLPDLELSIDPVESATTKFDLTLMLVEGETISGTLEYNPDLFDATTIQRLIGHFERLLAASVADPEQRLSELVFLGETERQQLLVDWNSTTVDYPRDVCLHTLIEQQAARTPEATALVFEGMSLTYGELNARANQLAHHLRSLDVGAETRVAVSMERSLELVIALVGVLKASGAYVPVDPSYPADRIQFMLDDAAAPVLLTQQHLESLLPPHSARVLRLDADWSTIAQQPTSNPALLTDATNLAYIIYTSGSTGQPKGAMNTHVAIVNRLLWMQEAFGLTASDRVLQKTPFSFDVSVWEFFWPLLIGATL